MREGDIWRWRRLRGELQRFRAPVPEKADNLLWLGEKKTNPEAIQGMFFSVFSFVQVEIKIAIEFSPWVSSPRQERLTKVAEVEEVVEESMDLLSSCFSCTLHLLLTLAL